ncbi:MAG: endolytic transglycosylase MltG [Candidatus Pacebacteria bacterium]|nr:endolytic transglycosylase MltG [Candidatus Paceibacterota bacterium]
MKKKIVISFVIFSLILILIGLFSYISIQTKIIKPFNVQDDIKKEFVIESGDSVKKIAANLESENLILGSDFFEIYIWQENLSSKLQAGKYELSPAMTISQMVDLFIGGKIIDNQIKITIPEGFLVAEIDQRLAEYELIQEGEFLEFDKVQNFDISKYEFLNDLDKDSSLEGFYFPDTYIYYVDASVQEIAEKMLDNFDKKLSIDLRQEIERQNKNIFEIITLASIIEKEAGSTKDMKEIASVFQNRLDIDKALESDATINYFVGEKRAQATYDDLKIDSPYNTYLYKGLTPGPISNPGIYAIEAAIYPEETDYFYFLSKDTGETVFSKTYDEHLINKRKFLD